MFEIKVYRPGTPWEQTPVAITGNEVEAGYDASAQFHFVQHVAWSVAHYFKHEVRWNWQGSPQGHYVSKTGMVTPGGVTTIEEVSDGHET